MEIVSEKLSYVYQPGTPLAQPALHDVTLRIPAGSFTAILGATGSGKSTFSQLVAGLLTPTAGSLQIGSHRAHQRSKHPSWRQHVGIVFQNPAHQLFAETVSEDIAFGPTNQGLASDIVAARVQQAMEWVGLPVSFLERSPFLLSGGEMRKVAIAGVLAMEPQILIFDEPTVGLDPASRASLLELIVQLHRERQLTILLVTHEQDIAAAFAEQIVLFAQGRCAAVGSPQQIFHDAALLARCNLAVPEIVQLMRQIEQGLSEPLPRDIFSLQQLLAALNERRRQGASG